MEHHFAKELTALYKIMITNYCNLEADLMNTQLVLAGLNPSEFANRLMRSEGYTAVLAGEIIYIVKCASVYVIIRHMKTYFIKKKISDETLNRNLSDLVHEYT